MLCRIEDLPVLLRPKMIVNGANGISPLSAKRLKSRNRIVFIGVFVHLPLWRQHPILHHNLQIGSLTTIHDSWQPPVQSFN